MGVVFRVDGGANNVLVTLPDFDIQEATNTSGSVTINSFTIIPGLSLVATAIGVYLVHFSATYQVNPGAGITIAVFLDGVQIPGTERNARGAVGAGAQLEGTIAITKKISLSNGQKVAIFAKKSSGQNVTLSQAVFVLEQVIQSSQR